MLTIPSILICVALTAYLVPLIIGSSLSPASPRTVAMALPLVMLTFGLPLLVTGALDRRVRVPFRVSSLPAHAPLPPLTYTIFEDVAAVDGGGSLLFRHEWSHRYQASVTMRRLLRNVALGWGVSGTAVGAGLIVAVWEAPRDTAYGLGFGIPWLWAIVCTAATFWYTSRMLEREKLDWAKAGGKSAHRQRRLDIRWKDKEMNREIVRREGQQTREKEQERGRERRRSVATDTTAVHQPPSAASDAAASPVRTESNDHATNQATENPFEPSHT